MPFVPLDELTHALSECLKYMQYAAVLKYEVDKTYELVMEAPEKLSSEHIAKQRLRVNNWDENCFGLARIPPEFNIPISINEKASLTEGIKKLDTHLDFIVEYLSGETVKRAEYSSALREMKKTLISIENGFRRSMEYLINGIRSKE